MTEPMIRDSIDEPWKKVSWEEALSFASGRLRGIQDKYGTKSIGAISSSRCTNEEVWLVQKMVRTGFGNNNVDTCARVCHSPTGYGLKQTLGESAGTQDFASVADADVIVVMGANPTEAHPVFGSRLKRRLREGASLIVIDPRRIELVGAPHIKSDFHLPVRPGSNVALLNAIAHTIVEEGLVDQDFVDERCEKVAFANWLTFIQQRENSPEAMEAHTGVHAEDVRAAARLYATGGNAAIYYGLGVTEHSQGSTTVMAIANLAMLTGNIGRRGVGVNPLRGQNNVQGSCDMGSFPHELPGYRPVGNDEARTSFESAWGVKLDPEPGHRIPNMFEEALSGGFKGLYCQGEDIAQSDPNTQHVEAALSALECLIVQDIFLNETAKFAHVFLPGSSFLEKDGTFTNAERRISRVRKAMEPLGGKADWQATLGLAQALGCDWDYDSPEQIMQEIAALTPTFGGVTYEKIERLGSVQWPCTDEASTGTPTMHEETFTRGLGQFIVTEYVPTDERCTRRFPLIMTTGRILSQYNVGAQTRRTENSAWHDEDVLEIHPEDAQERGIVEGDWVGISSRIGDTVLRAKLSQRVRPGVVYTTFHHPVSGANVITTDNSDWATNCPEYKVTAVQITRVSQPSQWQERQKSFDRKQKRFAKEAVLG
jgi:formate dehydrogenase major subunit